MEYYVITAAENYIIHWTRDCKVIVWSVTSFTACISWPIEGPSIDPSISFSQSNSRFLSVERTRALKLTKWAPVLAPVVHVYTRCVFFLRSHAWIFAEGRIDKRREEAWAAAKILRRSGSLVYGFSRRFRDIRSGAAFVYLFFFFFCQLIWGYRKF